MKKLVLFVFAIVSMFYMLYPSYDRMETTGFVATGQGYESAVIDAAKKEGIPLSDVVVNESSYYTHELNEGKTPHPHQKVNVVLIYRK